MMSRRAIRLLSLVTLVLCIMIHQAACKPANVIEDLGTLGGQASLGLGINATGNVCGGSYLSANDPHSAGYHAFRYVDGLGMIDVGALPRSNISEGQGINNSGLIVGGSLVENAGDSVSHAFLANATLNLTDLGTLGGSYSYAWDINDQGQVTGEASNRTGDIHAFILTSAGMRDIGTLGGNSSVGRSINANGQIAGESRVGVGQVTRAFRFTEGGGMLSLGTLPGGTSSSGYGINDSGQVVGESDTGLIPPPAFRLKSSSIFGTHAFLWTEGVGMVDLGILGDGFGTSLANAISNNGIVVGMSTSINGTSRAFRWTQAEGMIDLNTLLPRNSGWELRIAWDVNDKGQITGEGLHNGALHAFRFNPPEIVNSSSTTSAKAK
jgi:probable HAF family extracellular repeat protein